MTPLWDDDFADGLDMGPFGSGSRWSPATVGPIVPSDGVISRADAGIRIAASGLNPSTGEPAFTHTLPQDLSPDGLSGHFDHVKWLAFANWLTPLGVPGFEVVPGQILAVDAVIRARTYGTDHHPFGDLVADPDADPRLAVAALVCADVASGVVLDFFLTNHKIYAVYERLPYARKGLGHYAAFFFCVPVADRRPDQLHRVRICYDSTCESAIWSLDGATVFELRDVGRLIDRRHMLIDNGGQEQLAPIRQLACGLGMFSLLDGAVAGNPGLVDLSGAGDYFDIERGEPIPATFADGKSLESNRLFGQGAELVCRHLSVSRG